LSNREFGVLKNGPINPTETVPLGEVSSLGKVKKRIKQLTLEGSEFYIKPMCNKKYKTLTSLILISLFFFLTGCQFFSSGDKASPVYSVSIKDNVIFYKGDVPLYHSDSFRVTRLVNGEESIIEDYLDNVTLLDTAEVGMGRIEFQWEDQVVSLEIPVEEKNVQYEPVDSGVKITGIDTDDKKVIVPRSIDGLPVRVLGWPFFKDSTTEELEVSLPQGITTLESGVFENSSIEKINLPPGLESLGMGTFAASSLKEVTFNNSLTEIPMACFEDTQLERVVLPGNIRSVGVRAFSGSSIQELVIGEGIEKIEAGAFEDNSLEEVELPSGISLIGESAFSGNPLKEVRLEEFVSEIGEEAFRLDSREVPVFIHEDYNNVPDLISIFGVEPLRVNSVTKEKVFSLNEVSQFKNWVGQRIAQFQKGPLASWSTDTEADEYTLEVEILIFDEPYEAWNYKITKEADQYTYREFKDQNPIKTTTGPSLESVLPEVQDSV